MAEAQEATKMIWWSVTIAEMGSLNFREVRVQAATQVKAGLLAIDEMKKKDPRLGPFVIGRLIQDPPD